MIKKVNLIRSYWARPSCSTKVATVTSPMTIKRILMEMVICTEFSNYSRSREGQVKKMGLSAFWLHLMPSAVLKQTEIF